MMLLLVAMVVIPFLFWRGTWFGRSLTEQETGEYLSDSKRPRRTQHALVQLAERIGRGDPSARRWYPEVLVLGRHPETQVRSTAAWVMGQDNHAEEFHRALLELLRDPEPLVRRNAALALVRFADASGRPELVQMLHPYAVTAPTAGSVEPRLKELDPVNPGTLLARIETGGSEPAEVRSPLPGTIEGWEVKKGEAVNEGAVIVLIAPAEEQIWESLRALYLVGQPEDLEDVEPFVRSVEGLSDRIRDQAAQTAGAIRRRSTQPPTSTAPAEPTG